jgi:hypothetical protein
MLSSSVPVSPVRFDRLNPSEPRLVTSNMERDRERERERERDYETREQTFCYTA